MPPMPDRPRSLFGVKSQPGLGRFASSPGTSFAEELPTTPLPATNLTLDQKDTALLPTPPAQTRQLSNPGVTPQLSNPGALRPLSRAGITRQLSQPGMFVESGDGAGGREPVVIKGSMKKGERVQLTPRAHRKRRLLVTASGLAMLMLITAFALLAATPLGHDVGLNFINPQAGNNGQVTNSNSGGLSLKVQATATAVSQQHSDGYDPFSNGNVTISDGSGSLNWPVGQCTFWANYRYHALTGYWVSWTGNAAQWVAGARAAGWNVSQAPHVPSILVLMPYTQGAWGYGHVAVVESINDTVSPTVVHTSNMNWWVNGGGWDKESTADFTVGAGVYFVWHK